MKVKKIGIWILMVILGCFGAYAIDIFRRPCNPTISINIDAKDSKATVGQKLLNRYLKSYRYHQTCVSSWLSDYKISEVKADGMNPQQDKQFIVIVNYSIKPGLFSKKFWNNGGGQMEKGGWIKQFSSLTVENDNGVYRLTGIETGQ
jgi:hypothetical protein